MGTISRIVSPLNTSYPSLLYFSNNHSTPFHAQCILLIFVCLFFVLPHNGKGIFCLLHISSV